MRFFLRFLGISALLLPVSAQAVVYRSFEMGTGVRISLEQLFANIYGFAAASISSIATVVFLIGASYLVASHGDTNMVDKGKKIMIGALIGLCVTLGAYAILRTMFAIVY